MMESVLSIQLLQAGADYQPLPLNAKCWRLSAR
jgi:hypothetical protein